MRTEKQLLEKLIELRAIANALPHPNYFDTKEIASSPRVKAFAQIAAVLKELKQLGYEEPEPEHPVKWVNDLFQRLSVKYMSGTQNVSIRGTVLSNGTYVSVEPYHLFRYVDEQAFRFNNRNDMNDADRFVLAMRQIVGKRLTYSELIGKTLAKFADTKRGDQVDAGI